MSRKYSRLILVPACAALLLLIFAGSALASPPMQANIEWGRMPLCFIANNGQTDAAVSYYIKAADKTVFFTPQGLTFSLADPATNDGDTAAGANGIGAGGHVAKGRHVVKVDFLGAAAVKPAGQSESATIVSYFKGGRGEWRTGLKTYSSILYTGVWEGIDVSFLGTADHLKQEFVIAAGADPSQIRMKYRGADVNLNAAGQMVVNTGAGSFTDDAPIAYQEVGGRRISVPVAYRLQPAGAGTVVSYTLGAYDHSLPLVIDPSVFIYLGFLGGSSTDQGAGIAVDTSGEAFVTGWASSDETSFPVEAGPDPTFNGLDDAFVAKVNAEGTTLLYCGYIGGVSQDEARGIAVDAAGNAYVTGITSSDQTTFPVTGGPDATYNGGYFDAFVAKVNPAGTALAYCGYIGGDASDDGSGIAVDSSGNAYLVGSTNSFETSFPVAVGPDLTKNGYIESDAFVAKVNAAGTALSYCGYLGGYEYDYGSAVAIDSAGNAYVTGRTASGQLGFPVTGGPDLTYNGGAFDAFVAKVNTTGAALVYCGYIGGNGYSDAGGGIAVDSAGNAYVTGTTYSDQTTFPVTVGPDLTFNYGEEDAFVAKVNTGGTALVYCGYIGGNGEDMGNGVAVDAQGNAYVVGYTQSFETTFPVQAFPDLNFNGYSDGFVAEVVSAGTGLAYCGYLGGDGQDMAGGVAVGTAGSVYVTGYTLLGSYEIFVAKIGPSTDPVRYEEIDDHILGTGSWTSFTAAGASGGAYARSSTSGASVTLYFTGTRLDWIATKGTTTGIADVYLDRLKKATVNLAATSVAYQAKVWSTGTISDGEHQVDIVRSDTSAAGKYLTLDAVDVMGYLRYPPPTLTGISPNSGTVYGGTVVTLTGTYLDLATRVAVDRTVVDFTPSADGTKLTFTTPAHAAGAVNVEVVTEIGVVSTTFTYQETPVLMRYDQTSIWIVRSGTWTNYTSGASYEGSYGRASTAGASATVWFNGTQIHWIAFKGTTTGKADVYLDGVKMTTVDLSATSVKYQQDVWSSPTLTSGLHSFRIVRSSSNLSGKYITLDAVDIAGSIATAPARYEHTDSHIVKTGSWANFTSVNASGGSYGRSLTSGASATITFNGTRLDYIATKGTTAGIVDIYLDDDSQVYATINLAASAATYQVLAWSSGTLPSGVHTVRIVRNSSSASTKYLTLDAVDIWGTIQ